MSICTYALLMFSTCIQLYPFGLTHGDDTLPGLFIDDRAQMISLSQHFYFYENSFEQVYVSVLMKH